GRDPRRAGDALDRQRPRPARAVVRHEVRADRRRAAAGRDGRLDLPARARVERTSMTGGRPEGDPLGGMSQGDIPPESGGMSEGDIPPDAGAVRWGVLSTARINDKLLRGAREATGVEVVAVGSRDRA